MSYEPPRRRSRRVYDEEGAVPQSDPNAPFTGASGRSAARAGDPPVEEPAAAPAAEPAPPESAEVHGRPRPGWLAIGLLQVIALCGIVALSVIAGAILVDDTKVPGWIDGLALGTGCVILTLVVLFNGQRALRSRHHPRRRR
jgi:hypothetical protein